MNRAGRAFTFLELIIVVVTIAILAAIGIPNFLEAQVRCKAARVRSEFVMLAEALEAYHADALDYPPNLEPFHAAPGWSVQPVSRQHLPIAPPAPPPSLSAAQLATSPSLMPPAGPPFGPMPYPGGIPFIPEAIEPGMQANPFGLGPSFGPPGPPSAYVGAPSQPFAAQVADWETSPIVRSYLDRWGGADYVLSREASGANRVPPGGKNVAGRIAVNGLALNALTTPIPYLGFVPPDPFNDLKGFPYGYFCYSPYSSSPTWTLKSLNRSPRYLINSWGPDTDNGLADPYVGPFDVYDPTNGTVSHGDMIALDGVPLR